MIKLSLQPLIGHILTSVKLLNRHDVAFTSYVVSIQSHGRSSGFTIHGHLSCCHTGAYVGKWFTRHDRMVMESSICADNSHFLWVASLANSAYMFTQWNRIKIIVKLTKVT